MLEIDIIKYCFFSENERQILSYIANPDSSISNPEIFDHKLREEYDEGNENKLDLIKEKNKKQMEEFHPDHKFQPLRVEELRIHV